MNDGGRIALCGAISGYNSTDRTPGPDNMANIITRGLKLEGFTLANYLHHAPAFREKMTKWFAEGKIAYDETVVDGIENTVEDRKSTRLNSSHVASSYAVFCLKK